MKFKEYMKRTGNPVSAEDYKLWFDTVEQMGTDIYYKPIVEGMLELYQNDDQYAHTVLNRLQHRFTRKDGWEVDIHIAFTGSCEVWASMDGYLE